MTLNCLNSLTSSLGKVYKQHCGENAKKYLSFFFLLLLNEMFFPEQTILFPCVSKTTFHQMDFKFVMQGENNYFHLLICPKKNFNESISCVFLTYTLIVIHPDYCNIDLGLLIGVTDIKGKRSDYFMSLENLGHGNILSKLSCPSSPRDCCWFLKTIKFSMTLDVLFFNSL